MMSQDFSVKCWCTIGICAMVSTWQKHCDKNNFWLFLTWVILHLYLCTMYTIFIRIPCLHFQCYFCSFFRFFCLLTILREAYLYNMLLYFSNSNFMSVSIFQAIYGVRALLSIQLHTTFLRLLHIFLCFSVRWVVCMVTRRPLFAEKFASSF